MVGEEIEGAALWDALGRVNFAYVQRVGRSDPRGLF